MNDRILRALRREPADTTPVWFMRQAGRSLPKYREKRADREMFALLRDPPAAAEITAMVTIGAADGFGLPVSTTHVLSSGVAGTMVANRSGLQWATVRNLLMAWVLTLPVSIVLAGTLYWAFRSISGS